MEDTWHCPAEHSLIGTEIGKPPFGVSAQPNSKDGARFSMLLQQIKVEHERVVRSSRSKLLLRVQSELAKNGSGQDLTYVQTIIQTLSQEAIQSVELLPVTPRSPGRDQAGAVPSHHMIVCSTPCSNPDSFSAAAMQTPLRLDDAVVQDAPSCSPHHSVPELAPSAHGDSEHDRCSQDTPKSTTIRNRSSSKVHEFALAKGWTRAAKSLTASDSMGTLPTYASHVAKGAPRIFRCVRGAVRTQRFEAICGVAIILNVICQAITADLEANRKSSLTEKTFETIGVCFSVWFSIEIALRLIGLGCKVFFCGEERQWNIFDVFIVTVDVGEKVLATLVDRRGAVIQNLSSIRVLRILRIARIVRFIRNYKFFKDFRMMVFSLLRSFTALFWSICIFNLCVFVFSIYLMKSVSSTLSAPHNIKNTTVHTLKEMFGSVRDAQFTLYKTVSGGVDWGEVAKPLMEAHWFNGWVLCFYVFFTLLGVMNIITGIFVDRAIQSAANDRDEVISQQMEERTSIVRQMQRIFEATDDDNSGSLSLSEFEKHLKDERVAASFASIGLEVNEARGLFRLLDMDCSGEVSVEEFICGCMRLKGNAKSVDLVTLMYENKRVVEKLQLYHDHQNQCFEDAKVKQNHTISLLEHLASTITILATHAR